MMTPEAKSYQKKMMNPIVFWSAMLYKLPSAVFWRLRIRHIDEDSCQVTIPYTWRSQNPFRSIYFAALAGAAELSTGALCQLTLAGRGEFSMLVIDFRAEFSKKANQKITFICTQGKELNSLIEKMKPGDTDSLTMISAGTNPEGELVAKFFVTWSFKRKS